MNDPTHASFFSGCGGLDLGLERAGWRTVSFSEIDPYASAVLSERWPGVPNLGDITGLADSCRRVDGKATPRLPDRDCPVGGHDGSIRVGAGRDAGGATLWSGGFPCQDLSVAGKRRGMGTADERTRSGLAYAFLDLVERHRPPAILLENVPGLLSSNGGKDFGALLSRLGQLGYWWAYRILDAQFFGVPQRRRRVFICALHAGAGFGADSPAAVLSVGARCDGHSQTGDEAGSGAAGGAASGVDIVGTLDGSFGHHGGANTLQSGYQGHYVANGLRASDGHHGWSSPRGDGADNLISASPDSRGVRTPDGLARGLDDLAPTLRVGPARPQDGGPGDTVPIIAAFRKSARPTEADGVESWVDDGLANTLNAFDVGDIRTTHIALNPAQKRDAAGLEPNADSLLPLGLDSHRYRCCGNGVVSDVSEWIGRQLMAAIAVERVVS